MRRRVLVSFVIAVLLVQPSLWALCAEHCAPVAAAPQAATTASAATSSCHEHASANQDSRVRERLSAPATCPQVPADAFDAQPVADATRQTRSHDALIASASAFLSTPAIVAHAALAPSSALAVSLHAIGARAAATSPHDGAPLVLRI